ncbi:MAG: ABC transporter permease [Anaerolineales bacterium]
MKVIIDAIIGAINLLRQLDPELLEIVVLTLKVTGGGLFFSILIGLPLGVGLGLSRKVPAEGLVLPLIYTGMGMPPVVAGLFVFLFFSNQGPLGDLRWLFTPQVMVVAQTLIALPLMVGLTLTAVQSIDPMLNLQVKSLGATRFQLARTVLAEARLGLFAAIVTSFGSIISEVGAVMLVGGNIQGETRVLTTAIVLETRKGNFSLALALGIVLLILSFSANFMLYKLQTTGVKR